MAEQPSDINRVVSQEIRGMEPPLLDNYPDAPIYDHNLIIQLVKVRPIVLWKMEQHLGISPNIRSMTEQSDQKRRYSERDLIALLWIRERIVAGEHPEVASARLIAAQRQRSSSRPLTSEAYSAAWPSDSPVVNARVAPNSTPQLMSGGQAPFYPGFSPSTHFWQASDETLPYREYPSGAPPTPEQINAQGAAVYGVEAAPTTRRFDERQTDGSLGVARTAPMPARIVRPATSLDMAREQAVARELRGLIAPLMQAFSRFDTAAANKLFQQTLERSSVEAVCLGLAQPAIARISDLWSRNEMTIPEERFAFSYLRGFLTSIFHSTLETAGGKLVALGCAQHDTHDLPALLLAVFLRRAGLNVTYLGADAGVEDLARQRWDKTPALIVLSLASAQRIRSVNKLAKQLQTQQQPHPDLAYTGAIFARNFELQRKVNAIYLGDDPAAATITLRRRLGIMV
jgi:methanogenic corrinoid protein MtbC1